MEITIITGERGAGKTTMLRNYLDRLNSEQEFKAGFYALNVGDLYKIVNINRGENAVLCRRNDPEAGNLKLADFWFDRSVIKLGERWLTEGFEQTDPLFVIDEIGKFELEGFVWDTVLKKILAMQKGRLLVTVRKKFLKSVIEKYGLKEPFYKLKVVEVKAG